MSTPFRNSSGTRITKGLFFETADIKDNVYYTLKREDHLGYPSLYRLYIEAKDLAEHRFAKAHLDGWEHWEMMCDASWFKPFVSVWRRELSALLETEALDRMQALAVKDSAVAFPANKYLLDCVRKPKGAISRGRPTKDAITKETARMASAAALIDNDYKRLLDTGSSDVGPRN